VFGGMAVSGRQVNSRRLIVGGVLWQNLPRNR
jgi:hypothetical protein